MKTAATQELNDSESELLDLDNHTDGEGGEGGDDPEDRGDDFVPGDAATGTPAGKTSGAEGGDGNDGGEGNEGAEGDDAAKPGARIPKARLDEVISQREDLKAQLETANARIKELDKTGGGAAGADTGAGTTQNDQPDDKAELKTLRAAHREALMDGNMEKAEELDDLIDAKLIKIAEGNVLTRVDQQFTARTVKSSLEEATAECLTEFPYLDTAEGAEALDLIVMSRDKRIAAGTAPAQALKDAVAAIAPKFAPADGGKGTTDPDKGLNKDGSPKDTRTANALSRGAADSNNQPPTSQGGVGNRTTAARVDDVSKMTEEQFENLPEAEKKRLRGD